MPALRTIDIPFPLSTAPGIRRQESAGRIINGYVEPLGETAATPAVTRRAPGLLNFGTTTRTGFRGAIEINGILYCAFNGQLEKFPIGGGPSTNVGALTGTRKGFFARNNRIIGTDPPDQVFVDPDGNIAIFTPTSVTNSYPDVDLPSVNSVTSIDGYFIFTAGNGRAYASGLNTTAVDPLSFGTAEAKPDGLTRGIAYAGQLFFFGGFTTEVWSNVGTIPFPFQRATVIPRGILGPYCVAGFEDNFGRALVWIADDNAVYRLEGYSPQKISPPDLDGLIEAVADKTTLEMSVYMSRGHAFVLVSSPAWSWVFDLNTEKWAERNSYQLARSRIVGGIGCFGKWLCGDTQTGNIQQITNRTHQEIGAPFRIRIESGPVEKFPIGERIGRADFNFVTGVGMVVGTRQQNVVAIQEALPSHTIVVVVGSTALLHNGEAVNISGALGTTEANGTWPVTVLGPVSFLLVGSQFVSGHVYAGGGVVTFLNPQDPIETDPSLEISWSDDGGQTYFAPVIRKLGQQSQTEDLISLVSCTGRSRWNGRRWRLDIADPVFVGFLGATQSSSPLVRDI